MNKYKMALFTVLFPLFLSGQTVAPKNVQLSFAAVIVKDFDKSVDWYTKNFGFEIVNKVVMENRGIKQVNLKQGDVNLELIELQSALDPNEKYSDSTTKNRFLGFFKIGFSVQNFDSRVKQLTSNGVVFQGKVVTDSKTLNRMVIVLDPDGNRIQLFEDK
jgi:catechol 2,3-dioxygenase-like lactoylglutathione lyase family enzyme